MSLFEAVDLVLTAEEPPCRSFEQLAPEWPLDESTGFALSVGPDAQRFVGTSFTLEVGRSASLIVGVNATETVVERYFVDFGEWYGATSPCVGTTVSFRLIFDHSAAKMTVRVRIRLTGDRATSVVRSGWKDAILEAWSNLYDLVAVEGDPPSARYRILIDLVWLSEDDRRAADHIVAVHDDSCAGLIMDDTNWWTARAYQAAAHEFGHILGNVDEYSGCVPFTDSIMSDQRHFRGAIERHYTVVKHFAELSLCARFEVVPVSNDVEGFGDYLTMFGEWFDEEDFFCD